MINLSVRYCSSPVCFVAEELAAVDVAEEPVAAVGVVAVDYFVAADAVVQLVVAVVFVVEQPADFAVDYFVVAVDAAE